MPNKALTKLLDRASVAYYNGSPFMSDAEFDVLQAQGNYSAVGASSSDNTVEHLFKMYSLSKVIDDEEYNISYPAEDWVGTQKLDGAAVQVTYIDGNLAVASTRGDGNKGQDITEKMLLIVPNKIDWSENTQIVGELLVKDKSIENSRNFAAGALNLKDIEEFKTRIPNLVFIAYNIQNTGTECETYLDDMKSLKDNGFNTVIEVPEDHTYPVDGLVYRLNSNEEFDKLGFTNRHPRGAYARKLSSDVEIKETKLLEVKWQVGSSGKVTPVAIFEEVVIEDAKITRATLHNPGFIEELGGLSIGDTLLITRSGGVIPKVLGKL